MVLWIMEEEVFEENASNFEHAVGSKYGYDSFRYCEPNRFPGFKTFDLKGAYYKFTDVNKYRTDIYFYGSINMCRYLYKNTSWNVWTPDRGFNWNDYSHFFHNNLTNKEYVVQPISNVPYYIRRTCDNSRFFVKPVSGYKPFPGQVVKSCYAQQEIDCLMDEYVLFEDELCVVAPYKKIDNEYRFFISNGSVITGSSYMQQGNIVSERCEESHPAFQCAKVFLSESNYENDNIPVWTMDIAETDGKYSILEINSFSSAGLYSMDINKVVAEVVKNGVQNT